MPICEKGFANLYININIGFCLNSQSVNQAPGASKASKSGDTIPIYFSVFARDFWASKAGLNSFQVDQETTKGRV